MLRAGLLLALLFACAQARQLLVVTTSEQGQISVNWELPVTLASSPDLPLDEPPLVSRHAG